MTVHLHRFHPYLRELPKQETPKREPRSYIPSNSIESSLQTTSTSAFQPRRTTFQALPTDRVPQKKVNPLKALTVDLLDTYLAVNQLYARQERTRLFAGGISPKFESVKHTYDPLTLLSSEGISSTVYKSIDRSSNEAVAIKLFKDFVPLSHIHKEADLLRRVEQAPHALSLKAEYADALVTKLIDRPNLFHQIHELNLQDIASIALQSFEFLSFLAENGLITGDFKPENLMYDRPQNNVTFLDMGAAFPSKVVYPGDVQSSFYRAPEARLGINHYTPALDIWSAGCVLFELYTGEVLFRFRGKKNEEEGNLYLLHTTEFHLGQPPLEWLNAGTNTDLFYENHQYRTRKQFDRVQLKPAPPDFQAVTPWKIRMRQLATTAGNSPSQVEPLIDLIDRCIRYKNRITAQEALRHPFFQGQTHLILEFDASLLKPYFVYINNAKKVSISKLPLSSLPRCIHLHPSEGNNYTFFLADPQKKILGSTRLTLENRSVVHIKPHERGWIFELMPRSGRSTLSASFVPRTQPFDGTGKSEIE